MPLMTGQRERGNDTQQRPSGSGLEPGPTVVRTASLLIVCLSHCATDHTKTFIFNSLVRSNVWRTQLQWIPPFHFRNEGQAFWDSILNTVHPISENAVPQFVRVSFLADNDFSFNVFPNEKPQALPSLQMLSHHANFLLMLFLSHSQFLVTLGLLN